MKRLLIGSQIIAVLSYDKLPLPRRGGALGRFRPLSWGGEKGRGRKCQRLLHSDIVRLSLDVLDDTAKKQFEQLENTITIVRN
jgi:hypothetical protein